MMIKEVVLSLSFIMLLGCGEDNLSKIDCGGVCYTGKPGTVNVGTCKFGKAICDEHHNYVKCDGEVTPKTRTCTITEDVSCDNFKSPITDHKVDDVCGTQVYNSPCHYGVTHCIDHQVVCIGDGKPQQEQCSPDGYDFNCDGIPNNIDKLCYDGDPNDLSRPNTKCKAGSIQCYNGQEQCVGEITPSPTLADVDIILLMNGTGVFSTSYVNYIKNVFNTFAQLNNTTHFRYAIVRYPGNNINLFYPFQLDMDFDTSINFERTLMNDFTDEVGDPEYPFDAFTAIGNNTLGLHFTDNSKKYIIYFGDDNDCPFIGFNECIPGNKTMTDAISALTSQQIELLVYVTYFYVQDYDYLIMATHGQSLPFTQFSLSLLQQQIVESTINECH